MRPPLALFAALALASLAACAVPGPAPGVPRPDALALAKPGAATESLSLSATPAGHGGDTLSVADIRAYAARAGASDARSDCADLSRDRAVPGRFAPAYAPAKLREIADWARGYYGARAPIYVAAVRRGYADGMAGCRAEEMAERRRTGRTLYDVAASAESARVATEARERRDRDLDDLRRETERLRDAEAARARQAETDRITRIVEDARRAEEERRLRRRVQELEEARRR